MSFQSSMFYNSIFENDHNIFNCFLNICFAGPIGEFIKIVQTLDIFEAEKIFGILIIKSRFPIREQLIEEKLYIAKTYFFGLIKQSSKVLKKLEYLDLANT